MSSSLMTTSRRSAAAVRTRKPRRSRSCETARCRPIRSSARRSLSRRRSASTRTRTSRSRSCDRTAALSVEQLETERLVLEPIGPQHARTLFRFVSDVRLFTYVDQDPPTSERALEMRYRGWSTGLSPDGSEQWLNWAARLRGMEDYVRWFQAT